MVRWTRNRYPGTSAVFAVALLVAATLTGCGRKAPPLPPQIRRPDATRDLTAEQVGTQAVLRWSYPSTTTAGGALPDLERIEVWRATLPLGQEPPASPSARDQEIRVGLLQGQGDVLRTLDPAALDEATRGSALVISDDLGEWLATTKIPPGEAVLWYSVRSVCCGGRRSDFSNIARLEPQAPPDAPTGLAATVAADGIHLTWDPEASIEVLVSRSSDGETWTDLTPEPVAATEWVDSGAAQDTRWSYRVRAVRKVMKGGRVVGPPGPAVAVDYPDVYPPSPPEDLVCLPEGVRVRLRWQRAEGATGYQVSRQVGGADPVDIGHTVSGLSFDDEDPPLGSLTYGVEAVDVAGNRSQRVTCTAVIADEE